VNLTLTRDIEREINQIRLKICEETKDMTLEQRREYYRRKKHWRRSGCANNFGIRFSDVCR
jgi:hypothetical protein